ncbi:MAG: imidazole glycerol phosphate synthase subunit HisH [Chloroflexi bacterium]|nr:imidazole glycerol phosphate synthase subunit HisH [Chloroflexota bacterium]
MDLVVIDYGAGNLRSVAKAFKRLGQTPRVTSDPAEVLKADAIVLPGVGAASDAMRNLTGLRLAEALRQVAAQDKPFFGVCLGLQILFESTEEGGAECLGILPGRVLKLPSGLKVPHMGWNQVRQVRPHPVFDGVPDGAHFYFVHSYYASPSDSGIAIGATDYGIEFASAIGRGNLVATQFHPEKSGDTGLRLYANFLRMAQRKAVPV